MGEARTIHSLFAERARAASEATALVAPGRAPLSYGRLLRLVEGTVRQLRARGIGRGDRVAMVLENGPEMAAAFVAVASGAAAAPLNPAYGRNEFDFYLSDLRPKALLITVGMESAAREVAETLAIPVIELAAGEEAGWFSLGGAPEDGEPEFGEAGDTALVLHTSGTTSRPKMVPLTQGNLCASAGNIAATLGLTREDRCLNVMPLFHIHGLVGAVLSSLSVGANVACTPGFYVTKFFDWLDEFAPTWYTAVPTMHQGILARAGANQEIIARRRLRFIRSSSAALAPQVMEGLETVFGAPVIESYGMTEASHQMASNPLPPGKRKPGSVGLPAGPEIAIMDEAGTLLPPGATGEIVIRGANVTAGYVRNPEANAKAFTNGWFRTGDQGRFDEDGYLYITGRLKELINRGGEKISPREIDEALMNHPSVAQAVAFAVPHARLGEEIGVAVVAKDGAALTERDVREFAAARLADFKVPRVVKIVQEIPRGATGKLQRIGLAEKLGVPAMEDEPAAPAERVEPKTAEERKLAQLWSEVLGKDGIGVEDDFFRLGGDSMLATQLLARTAQEFGRCPAFVSFLEAPTIAGMARALEAGGPARLAELLVPIRSGGARPPLFFFPGHDGVLGVGTKLARQFDGDQPVYGLVPPPVEAGAEDWKLEELARRYLTAMRGLQPSGPYYLAGHCFGGTVAYAIATLVRKEGEEVGLLAILDCLCPWQRRGKGAGEQVGHLLRRVRLQWRALAGKPWSERIAHLTDRLRAFRAWHLYRLRCREYRFRARRGLRLPAALRQAQYANSHAARRYRPEPYEGEMVLFRVLDRRPDAPFMGWREMIRGEIRIYDAPYHYLGMTADEVAAVTGAQLRQALEEAQGARVRGKSGDVPH